MCIDVLRFIQSIKTWGLMSAFLCLTFISPVQAKLGSYNVIHIHGYEFDDPSNTGLITGLINLFKGDSATKGPPSLAEVIRDKDLPLKPVAGKIGDKFEFEDDFDFGSGERMEDEIAQRLHIKVIQYAKAKFCEPGCVIVDESTGDIVTRLLIQRQKYWLEEAGLPSLKIIATFDDSGAGFGADFADMMMNPIAEPFKFLLWKKWGNLKDLQTPVARTIAMEPQSVPRLRYANFGTGFLMGLRDAFLWLMTIGASPFKPNDGLVAGHSSCGSVSTDLAINSCSKYASANGDLKDDKRHPPPGLMVNHFPILMRYADGFIHAQAYEGGALTPAFPVEEIKTMGKNPSDVMKGPATSVTVKTTESPAKAQYVSGCFQEVDYPNVLPYQIDTEKNKVWFDPPEGIAKPYFIEMINANLTQVERAICQNQISNDS